jgi:hypothetical protein
MASLEFFIHIILPGVVSVSNRNEYQEYFLGGKDSQCVRLKTLQPSCADCLEIREPQPAGNLRICNRPEQGLLYFNNMAVCCILSVLL